MTEGEKRCKYCRQLLDSNRDFCDIHCENLYNSNFKKTIVLDVDGTLFEHSQYIPNVFGEPKPNVEDALKKLIQVYRLVVHTGRPQEERQALIHHLNKHHLLKYFDDIVCNKPIAVAYIDDRGYNFNGDWNSFISEFPLI